MVVLERGARWRYLAIVLGVVVVVGVAVVGYRLYPWLRGPDTAPELVAARWAKVQQAARQGVAVQEEDEGADAGLLAAAQLAAGFSPPRHGSGVVPIVNRDGLPSEEVEALKLFRSWHEAGGRYVASRCLATGPRADAVVAVFRLGQLTIYSAMSEDIADVDAVLEMAAEQRRSGRLVDHMVGLELALLAATWSKARGVSFGAAREAFRPTVGELPRAIARGAVCVVGALEGRDSSTLLDPPGPAYSNRPSPAFGIVSAAREIAVFKDLHGRVYEQAVRAQHDHDKLRAVYQQAEEDRPKSLLLDATWMYSHLVEQALTRMAEYDAILPRP